MRAGLVRARTGMAAAGEAVMVGVEVTRARNSVAAAVYVLLGIHLSGVERALAAPAAWGSCLAAALAVAAAFVHNDIEDEDVDRHARRDRPIPSGRLSRRVAHKLFAALAILSVAVAWWSSDVLPLLVLGYLFFSVLYSRHLKGTVLLGNVTVAALVGSLPLYGGVAAGHVDARSIAAAAMVFCFCLGQEILFTLEDVEGDSRAGLRTTATQFGAAGSLRLFQTVTLVASVVCLLPWYLGIAGTAYAIAALVCTVVPILVAGFSLRPNDDPRKLARVANGMGVIWWTSIVPLVLLR